jgi:hypothetical protein
MTEKELANQTPLHRRDLFIDDHKVVFDSNGDRICSLASHRAAIADTYNLGYRVGYAQARRDVARTIGELMNRNYGYDQDATDA